MFCFLLNPWINICWWYFLSKNSNNTGVFCIKSESPILQLPPPPSLYQKPPLIISRTFSSAFADICKYHSTNTGPTVYIILRHPVFCFFFLDILFLLNNMSSAMWSCFRLSMAADYPFVWMDNLSTIPSIFRHLGVYTFCSHEHLCVSSCTCVSISERFLEVEFLCQRTVGTTTHPTPDLHTGFIFTDSIYYKL